MTTEMRQRLEEISRLAEVNLEELSLGITQESRTLAILSEERRQAIQELLGLLGRLDGAGFNSLDDCSSSTEHRNYEESEPSSANTPAPSVPDEHWLTVNQISTILRVNPLTVRRWIRAGQISHVVLPGRGYRIGAGDLASFISAHYQRAD